MISAGQLSQPPKDERKAECPYCHQALNKTPSRKTKCPHCGKFMFIRYRPKDNARVIVTEEEADRIDEEWSIVNGTHDIYIANKKRFEQEKEALRKRFGKEPSDNDVEWSLLNKELIEYAKTGEWRRYRHTRFHMAEILYHEKKLGQALQTYLEVCYLDLNGALDKTIADLSDESTFNPDRGSLVLGAIRRIQRVVKKLGLEKEELKSEFLKHNARIQKALNLPLSPEDCWTKVEDKVWEL